MMWYQRTWLLLKTDTAPKHWDTQQPDVDGVSLVGVNKNRLGLNYVSVDELRKLLLLRQNMFDLVHKKYAVSTM